MNVILKYKLKTVQFKSAQVYDIYLRTQASDSSDPNVFMMQVLPKNYLGEDDSMFSHVATPVDMQDYPVGYNRDYAYYRTNSAILRVGSVQQAQDVLQNLKKAVSRLNRAVTILQSSDSNIFMPMYQNTQDGNIQSSAVLEGYIGYNSTGRVTGAIPSIEENYYEVTSTGMVLSSGQYLAGNQVITPYMDGNIRSDTVLNGFYGMDSNGIVSGAIQSLQASSYNVGSNGLVLSSGYYLAGDQVFYGSGGITTSDGNISSDKVLSGYIGYNSVGKVTGSIPSVEGSQHTITISGPTEYTVPGGIYLAGSQTVDIQLTGNITSDKVLSGYIGLNSSGIVSGNIPEVQASSYTLGSQSLVISGGVFLAGDQIIIPGAVGADVTLGVAVEDSNSNILFQKLHFNGIEASDSGAPIDMGDAIRTWNTGHPAPSPECSCSDTSFVYYNITADMSSSQIHAVFESIPQDLQNKIHVVKFEEGSYSITPKLMSQSQSQYGACLIQSSNGRLIFCAEDSASVTLNIIGQSSQNVKVFRRTSECILQANNLKINIVGRTGNFIWDHSLSPVYIKNCAITTLNTVTSDGFIQIGVGCSDSSKPCIAVIDSCSFTVGGNGQYCTWYGWSAGGRFNTIIINNSSISTTQSGRICGIWGNSASYITTNIYRYNWSGSTATYSSGTTNQYTTSSNIDTYQFFVPIPV